MQRLYLVLISVFLSAASMWAQPSDSLAPYRPSQTISGTIRVTGKKNAERLIHLWADGFRKYHPSARVEARMTGTASGMAGVYTGTGDIAVLGREMWADVETMAFKWVFRHDPVEIAVATGSFTAPRKSPPLVIFVSRQNPLSKLTIAQLDAIYGSEHKRSDRNIRMWGDLGLTGKWASKPISVYGHQIGGGYGVEFQRRVMKDSFKWNCNLTEFRNTTLPNGSTLDAGYSVVTTLSKDPYGMAFTGLPYGDSRVKAIAIVPDEGGEPVMPTPESVRNGSYPLTRTINFFFSREPGQQLDPKIDEFVRYILSREGQQQVVEEGEFVPLAPSLVNEQLKKLDK